MLISDRERSELTSLRANVSAHAIRKCSIYVALCRFQFNGTVEGLHHTHSIPVEHPGHPEKPLIS